MVSGAGGLPAADLYWGGNTDNSFLTLTNWWTDLPGTTPALAVPGSGDRVFFSIPSFANPVATLGANTSLSGIVFNENSGPVTLGTLNDYTLTLGSAGLQVDAGSGAVTINSNVAIGAAQIWNHLGSNPLEVAGAVTSSHNLTINGTGAVNFTGGMTSVGNWSLNVNDTAEVQLNTLSIVNSTITMNVASGAALTVNGAISGTGGNLEKYGLGTLTLNEATSFSGNFRIRDGEVVVNQSNLTTGNQLIFGAASGAEKSDGFGILSLAKSSTTPVVFNLNGAVYAHYSSKGGLIQSVGSGSVDPVLNLNGERSFIMRTVTDPEEIRLRVSVGLANGSSTGHLNKRGTATMLMEGVNTYTGVTNVDRGKLIIDYGLHNGDNKLSNTNVLRLRGGWLELSGNDSAATLENIDSMSIGLGVNTLKLVSKGGNELNLHALKEISRAVNNGVLNLVKDANSKLTLGGTGLANNSAGFVGGWFIYGGNRWAARSGNEIVEFTGSAVKNQIHQWSASDDVIVNSALTGTLLTPEISSLIIDSTSASTIQLNNNASVLTVAQSAILVSDKTSTNTTIQGGQLMSKNSRFGATNEMIITNLSNSTLTLGANLGTNNTYLSSNQNITFAGKGLIDFTGSSAPATRTTAIQGSVRVSKSNALGSYTQVVLGGGSERATNGAKLDINGAQVVIGRLSGGRGGDNANYQELGAGEIAMGTTNGVLTLNQTADSSYNGFISGTGTLIKKATGKFTMQNQTSTFTGQLHVLGGSVVLTNSNGIFPNLMGAILRGGELYITQNASSGSVDHIRSATPIQFQGTSGHGFALVGSNSIATSEQVNSMRLEGGSNTITVSNDNTSATSLTKQTTLIFNGAANTSSRTNKATLLVRGLNLGGATSMGGAATAITFSTATNITNSLIGGGGSTAGAKNLSILYYAIGENSTTHSLTLGSVGNSFMTYGAGGTGLRALTDNEYTAYGSAASNENVSLNAALGAQTGKTINSLRLVNSSGNVDLAGTGDLILTSGALLVTSGATDNDSTLSFDTITSGQTVDELVVSVTSSHGAPTGSVFTLNSGIVDNGQAVSLTKSGEGTLLLTGNNLYTGETTINRGVLEFGATTGNLGTGTVRLAGGTLRWGVGNTTDLSAGGRTVELLGASAYLTPSAGGNIIEAGNMFDIGANNITMSSPIGNGGYGGLSKMGSGTLTLSAVATYKGATVIREGAMNFSAGIAANTTEDLYLIRTTSGVGIVSSNVTGGLNVKNLVVGGAYGATAGTTTGLLTVTSGAVNIQDPSGFVLIGYRDSSAGTLNTSHVTSRANFTNASSVSINTSQLEVGIYKGGVGTGGMSVAGALDLSNGANTVTSGSIVLGHAPTAVSNIGAPSSITFGSSSNTVNTDIFVIAGARSLSNVTVRSGGTFTLRGWQGGETGANLFIGDNDVTGTNVISTGHLDLSNASNVDARVNLLLLGRIASTAGAGAGRGTLTFVNGEVKATTIQMSNHNYHDISSSLNAQNSFGVIHQRGTATLRYQTMSTTNSTVAALSGANVSTAVANHNWQGGTVQNLEGDNLVNVNVTVNLTQNGSESLLDPTRRNFVVDAGRTATFQSEAEFAGAGSMTKSGEGDLILEGTNINTGNVRIAQGGVALKNNATMDDAAWVNIESGATLRVSQRTGSSYASDAVISGTGTINATSGTFTVTGNRGVVNTQGVIRPGASTVLASASTDSTVGDQTGTLQVSGNLVLAGAASDVDRAVMQVGATNRNVLDHLSSYATREAWIDALPTYDAGFLTGAGTNHDLLSITGDLKLESNSRIIVTAANGYTGSEGDVFNLLDWGTVSGSLDAAGFVVGDRYQTGLETANDLQLFALGNDLLWDTKLFLSHGVLVVVIPEPSRALLLLFALSALVLRRKR